MKAFDAVLFDYGGVLTTSATASFRQFEDEAGLPQGTLLKLLERGYGGHGIIAEVERGEVAPDALDGYFRDTLAAEGYTVSAPSIPLAMFARVAPEARMWSLAELLRSEGLATGLLTNSWGTSLYDFSRIATTFDDCVVSAEVGMRKPDREIFELAARRLTTPPSRCVFVDDMPINVAAAEQFGMTAVLHESVPATAAALSHLTGVQLPQASV